MRKRSQLLLSLMLLVSFGSLPAETSAANVSSTSSIVYQDWTDSGRNRIVPVKIYLPKSGRAPYPVVIFSHGLGGSREAAVYLGEYWSEHGYFCVFVQHAGSDESVWRSSASKGREGILQSMKVAANGQNLLDRIQDIKFVLDQLEQLNSTSTDPLLRNKLDLSRIALSGHSFGAGTTLACVGQSFGNGHNAKDPRIKAAIYLCPPVMGSGKASPATAYGDIQVPGLLLTGTEDNSPIRDTKAEDRRIPYDGMRAHDQYLVNFAGADHATFGGRSFRQPKAGDDQYHAMIDEMTTKFLDAELKGDASAKQWLNSAQVTSYLGKSATFERK
jgi:predicted dienelactone hydrolase